MTYQQPLEPDEIDQRATQANQDVAASGDPLEPEPAGAAEASPPWVILGVVLLAVFVVVLVLAVVAPALR